VQISFAIPRCISVRQLQVVESNVFAGRGRGRFHYGWGQACLSGRSGELQPGNSKIYRGVVTALPVRAWFVVRFAAAIASGNEVAIKRHAFWSSRFRDWALMSPPGGTLYYPEAIDRFGNFVQAAKRDSGRVAQ